MTAAEPPLRPPHRSRLQLWILLGLAVGLAAGLAANFATTNSPEARDGLQWAVRNVVQPVGSIFLRLLFMTVIPLVFSALTLGMYGLGDLRALGRIGLRTLLFTLVLSSVAVVVGVGLVNLFRPGDVIGAAERDQLVSAVSDEQSAQLKNAALAASKPFNVQAVINAVIPRNPVEAASRAFDGDMLAVLFFALAFGIALRMSGSPRAGAVVAFLEGVQDVSFWMIGAVFKIAPIGVAALIFAMASTQGLPVLRSLVVYVLTVLLGLALVLFGVYPVLLRFLCGVSPLEFFKRIREILVTAFSTASSNATLPTTLRIAKERLGVSERVADFVLTLGSTLNQNGTALFEGVTILFLAQLYGVDLSLGKQVMVVVISVLAGVGTAGVPSGSIPLLVPILVSVGVPGEGVLVILGVNTFLDMCRTVLNVVGDLVVAIFVAKGEKELTWEAEGRGP